MRYLIYLVLSFGFFAAQAQDGDETLFELFFYAAQAQDGNEKFFELFKEKMLAETQGQDKAFNPYDKKAEICQQSQKVEEILSCDPATADGNCPVLYESAVSFLPFQLVASQACSFECVVGEQMCDETLHPDYKGIYGFEENIKFKRKYSDSRCSAFSDGPSSDDMSVLVIDRKEYYDAYGVKHITIWKEDLETECVDRTEYVEICREEGGGTMCTLVTADSEEWFAYQRELQMKQYEESCVVPTEDDCKNIRQNDTRQCMLDVAQGISEFFCSPSTDNLWKYRGHGLEGVFLGSFVKSPKVRNLPEQNVKMNIDMTVEKSEECAKLKDDAFNIVVSSGAEQSDENPCQ